MNFGIDNSTKRLIVLTGIKNNKLKRNKFITLLDIENEQIIYSKITHDLELIGRLKSNLYIFVEGHIYYGNKVIKIRYDLINNQKYLDETKIFNQYNKILPIKNPNYNIQSGLPLQTCLYNRLVYVFTNQNQFHARRILILPFLHDRKIVLNRRIEGQ